MATIRITKQFSFEMAHALMGYDGLCKNIHGHSYKLDVTVTGCPNQNPESPKLGMLIDFSDLKNIVNQVIIKQLDHALLLNEKTDSTLISQLKNQYEKVYLTSYQPTTENMLSDFATRIQKALPQGVSLYALRLRETDSSFAEWISE